MGNSSLKLLLLLIHLTQHNLFILTQHNLLFVDYETNDLDMHGGSCVPTMNYIQGPQSHVQTRCLFFFLLLVVASLYHLVLFSTLLTSCYLFSLWYSVSCWHDVKLNQSTNPNSHNKHLQPILWIDAPCLWNFLPSC